ncbi:monocarboxylate transporter 12-like [Glandiceps talaboti]
MGEQRKHRNMDYYWKWLVVIGSFLLQFYMYGLATSNGLLMIEFLRYFENGAAASSLILTVSGLVTVVTAPIIGYLVSRYGARPVATVGAAISVIGMVTTAFAESLLHVIITYGLFNGVGTLIFFIPGNAIVATYFDKRYALAYGIAGLGAGIGGMVFPLMMEAFIRYFGWHGTFFILSGCSANIFVCAALMKPVANKTISKHNYIHREQSDTDVNAEIEDYRNLESAKTQEYNGRADLPNTSTGKDNMKSVNDSGTDYRDEGINQENRAQCSLLIRMWGRHLMHTYPQLISLVFCKFAISGQTMITSLWIVIHAVTIGIPGFEAAMLMTYLGLSIIVARLFYGWVGDLKFISPLSLLALTLLLNTIFVVACSFPTSYVVIVVCCVGTGLCQGVVTPLIAVYTKNIVGADKFANAYGLLISAMALGTVMLPVAGQVYEDTGDSRTPFYVAGTCSLVAAIVSSVTSYVLQKQAKRRI